MAERTKDMRRTGMAELPAAVKGHKRRKRRRRERPLRFFLTVGVCMAAAMLVFCTPLFPRLLQEITGEGNASQIARYAAAHGWSAAEYPEGLVELYKKHPEAEKYVMEYPALWENPPADELTDVDTDSVPLLMQWDQRWGYEEYAGNLFGLSGCGPTCLSMVAVYLTGDTTMTPGWMGRFAQEHGYGVEGSGSAWALFSEGGKELGFDVTEIPLDENRIIRNLEVDNPIVAVMGPGDFTTTGHFIVITGYEDGKLKVNDPNCTENSEKLWDYEKIKGQIRNLWVFRNP